MRPRDPNELVEAAARGDRAATARLISLVEAGGEPARSVGRLVYPHGGRAYTVGITGPPGGGKSTLTDRLLSEVRAGGDEVAVLAVDPSSPFSGGALLGDRVRMQSHATDQGVFIRSMATRGHVGGLALATIQAVRVLDAVGLPWVLIETVGVGQVEVEIAEASDTTVVVLNPGGGDAVQSMKAGLLEIADLFVVNKADRPGVRDLVRDLNHMLDMDSHMGDWRPPILRTVASTGEGVGELWAAVREHRTFLESDGRLSERRNRRISEELREIVTRGIEHRAAQICSGPEFGALHDRVVRRDIDPWSAAEQILSRLSD